MKRIPIGTEDFKKLIEEDFYYVDKTKLISELLSNWAEVNLFTRPRRFGKTLNMSMLQAFFDIKANPKLFDGLNISEDEKLCDQYQNKYPVISISLKDVNGDSYISFVRSISNVIGLEARKFIELKDSDKLLQEEKVAYEQLTFNAQAGEASTIELKDEVLKASLLTLSNLLYKHYGTKVIILIDEYDVPLEKANGKKFYDKVVELIRGILSRVLKSNENVQFAVLTGCLRVAKESIFTGLNNLHIMSIQDPLYAEYFGFLENEVDDLLEYYGLSDRKQEVADWYDGYNFGGKSIYCPWDVLKYCFDANAGWTGLPKAYWANVSGNSIVRKLIDLQNVNIKTDIETLVEGGTIEKTINDNLTYQEIYSSPENIWSVLYTTGYLTMTQMPLDRSVELKIPNLEVREIFVNQIKEWIDETTDSASANDFSEFLFNGQTEEAEDYLVGFLRKTISIRDTYVKKYRKENFYHGILIGLLGHNDDIEIRSNAEAGEGYSDIVVLDEIKSRGYILEVKYADDKNLENACLSALKQIKEKKYEELFEDRGISFVNRYGIACYMKNCKIIKG